MEAHGMYRQLHMHVLLYTHRVLHFTRESLDLGYGFYAHLRPVHDHISDVRKYITKYDFNRYERDCILAQNYANYYYLW